MNIKGGWSTDIEKKNSFCLIQSLQMPKSRSVKKLRATSSQIHRAFIFPTSSIIIHDIQLEKFKHWYTRNFKNHQIIHIIYLKILPVNLSKISKKFLQMTIAKWFNNKMCALVMFVSQNRYEIYLSLLGKNCKYLS